MHQDLIGVAGENWTKNPNHRIWLLNQAEAQFSFFEPNSCNPKGGFFALADDGTPLVEAAGNRPAREIHVTTRMVHAFCIAHLLGRPGADAIIDHGMQFLWNGHRDNKDGGFFKSIAEDGTNDGEKQAYGHAFVMLAASSAKAAGHPDADRLLADISEIIRTRFWDNNVGAIAEEFTADWQPFSDYRGQNSNMHLTEALMAAFEVTQDKSYLGMAESIAELIIGRHAADNNWSVPEHYSKGWEVDRDYSGDPVFRPAGTTPGHALEWARLLVQLWELGGCAHGWMTDAAAALFSNAVNHGWDKTRGGFYYTLEWNGAPKIPDRYWWPCCEGIGAAAFLGAVIGDPLYEEWYRRIWNFTAQHFIDKKVGGWFPQLDANGEPSSDPFYGKLDIYHSLQACVIPLLPAKASVVSGLMNAKLTL